MINKLQFVAHNQYLAQSDFHLSYTGLQIFPTNDSIILILDFNNTDTNKRSITCRFDFSESDLFKLKHHYKLAD